MTPSRTSPPATRLWSFVLDHWAGLIANGTMILIGLMLVAPLLQALPLQSDDGALHIYRTVALDRALQAGLLYPRWFPDLAYGYGFPFFNYREPLGYYAIESLHLIGLSIPLGLNLILAGSVIFSGLAMLWWVSDIFDLTAGWAAGVLYLAAPYLLIGPLDRANLPEVIALALLPLILFCFRRLIVFGGKKYFGAAVVAYSALLLTHNISSLIFTPMLLAYLFVLRRTGSVSPPIPQHAHRTAVMAIIVSLGLTAFFWLPALVEGNYVQLYLTHTNRNNDYHFNFLSLAELFGGPGSADPELLNPPLRFMLGWPQMIIAAFGLLALRGKPSRDQHAHIIAAIIAALVFSFMTLSISLPLWDNLPLIRFVQFPWRFVGRAMLPLALLAGAGIYYLRERLARGWFSASFFILTGSALLFAAPQLYPGVSSIKNNLNINDVFNYEHSTGNIGIDPVGAYLPVSVQQRPAGSPLETSYLNNQSIQRFDRSTLPANASITTETYGPNRAAISLSSPIGFRATYLTFDFPGWQVTIDQQPVLSTPADPTGLITFDVPAGQHHIEIYFGSTPVRTLADLLSVIALAALVTLLFTARLHSALIPNHPSALSPQPWLFLILPVAFILVKSTLIDPQLTPFRSTRLINDQIAGVSHPLQIDFGGQLRLLGYDISPGSVPSGESVRVDLYWRAVTPLDQTYQATLGIVDDRGEVWSPKSLDRPRGFQDYPSTPQWPISSYAIDSFELPIIPGTPPGNYSVFVEVFNRSTLSPLPAPAAAPPPVQRPADAVIGSIAVTRSSTVFSAEQLGIYNLKIDQTLAADIQLLGVNRDRDDASPGDTVLLTLFWQALKKPATDYAAQIELADAQNQSVVTVDFPVGAGRYSTSNWTAAEQVIDLDRVRVPRGAGTGTYHWRVTLAHQAPVDIGELRVTAPDRSFVLPAIPHRIDQTFDNKITLLGYNVEGTSAAGQQLKVTVYWRAAAEMDTSYKVFLHLLDAKDQPRAQADAIPIDGTRPTTGWQPGEILTDTYTLSLPADLPAGPYRITMGLYNPADLVRLKLSNGEDHVELK